MKVVNSRKNSRSFNESTIHSNRVGKEQNQQLAFPPSSKISQIPNIPIYNQIQKLRLSKQALQKIKQSLDIEHISKVQFQQRQKNKNYFINYSKNPFLIGNPIPQIFIDMNKAVEDKKTIIEAIQDLKQKNYNDLQKRLLTEDIKSNYIHKLFKDKVRNEELERKKKIHIEKVQKQKQIPTYQPKKISQFQQFDKIVSLKEQSFYVNRNKSKSANIFKILSNQQDQNFYLSFQRLKKVYFCEDSILIKPNSKKVGNAFRDLSFIARLFAKAAYLKVPKDYKLAPSDIKVIVEAISFNDLMMLSTGFIEPQILQIYLYEESKNSKKNVDDENSSLQEQQIQIFYNENQVNKSTLFEVQRHDRAEIQAYIHDNFSKMEQKQLYLSQMHKKTIMKYLQLQMQCKSSNIRDRSLLEDIRDKKKSVLIEQYDGKIRKQNNLSVDKMIRLNKRSKDRVDNIKNRSVIETIRVMKKTQRQIRSNSKSNKLAPKKR